MQSVKKIDPASVIEPNYFSNWGDLWYPKIANKLLLRIAAKISWITPNRVTVVSFLMYAATFVWIATQTDFWYIAALLLPVSYILDCLDGQLARFTGRSSAIGDYLDKTLDVLKIFIINLGMSLAAYSMTHKNYYFVLGLMSCFGFLFRYYIKLETMFGAVNKDADYLDKSRTRRHELYASFDAQKRQPKTFKQKLEWLWIRNHSVFALDEAEHVTFGMIAIIAHRPDVWLWVFGVGQITIAFCRLIERGRQLIYNPESLTYPLRK